MVCKTRYINVYNWLFKLQIAKKGLFCAYFCVLTAFSIDFLRLLWLFSTILNVSVTGQTWSGGIVLCLCHTTQESPKNWLQTLGAPAGPPAGRYVLQHQPFVTQCSCTLKTSHRISTSIKWQKYVRKAYKWKAKHVGTLSNTTIKFTKEEEEHYFFYLS